MAIKQSYVCFSLCMCALISPAWAGTAAGSRPAEIVVMLCDSPEHAIAYAVAINQGAVDEEAKNIVGKAAGREVCDNFVGLASPGEVRTIFAQGISYKVTAYQFTGVGAMRWSAIPQN